MSAEKQTQNPEYFIIDAIGPFFKKQKNKTVNWSKIPFYTLERKKEVKKGRAKKIKKRFKKFVKKSSDLGYNAISIDDLAHLVCFDFYPASLEKKLTSYKMLYKELFKIARKKNMSIFVNTDLMFFNKSIKKRTREKEDNIIELLKAALVQLFRLYEVEGVIFRVGESDGVDVKGDFISKLSIKTPQQANRYIRQLLPIFDSFQKRFIFRTWTVGIDKIGDLMWNPKTFAKAFAGIQSQNFIVSMKYGDTDFFDNLDLNPLFFNCQHKTILELQTRREREGFGKLPYYVGWQYQKYYQILAKQPNWSGISVWCQTGGWSRWPNLTFLKRSSYWNELNTIAVIQLFRYGTGADSILHALHTEKMVEFIQLCHQTFRKIIYISNFSDMTLYLRRFRLPPLLWLYWDHVIINPMVMALHDFVGTEPFTIPKKELKTIKSLGKKLNIPDIDFIYDTLFILAKCHKAIVQKYTSRTLIENIENYKEKHPNGLNFSIKTAQYNFGYTRILFKLFLRKQPNYRILDHFLMLPPTSYFLRLIIKSLIKNMPRFVNKQAMPVEALLK